MDDHATRIYEVRLRHRETEEGAGVLIVAETASEAVQVAEDAHPQHTVVFVHAADAEVLIGPSVRFRVLEETGERR